MVGVLSGSPRRGACEHLAREVVAPALEAGGCAASVAVLRAFDVAPCRGCGACGRTGTCVLEADERARARTGGRPGFPALHDWLAGLDALVLAAPLYFAGPPAQLKAALDRMQFLWARRYVLGTRPPLPRESRRPLGLVVVGGGGDPFGSDPLVTCVRSSLRMADFELVESRGLIGYRTGRPDVPGDEELESCAAALATALARAALSRGVPPAPPNRTARPTRA